MNLKYKILWFEDDEDVINEDVGPAIKDFLVEMGFQVEFSHHLNGENLTQLIQDKAIDLVVTDLNLGEHETGEKLIDHIREGNILTEVLLYSANANEINAIVEQKGWIERASFSVGLGNLKDKLKAVISLTIKKNQDVNNTRGLVIAETILLEKKIEKILLHYFDSAEDKVLAEHKSALLKSIHEKKVRKHEEDLQSMQETDFTAIKLLIENDILTASNSFNAIQSILNLSIKDINIKLNSKALEENARNELTTTLGDLKGIKEELDTFRDEILKIRNTLAHVIEEVGEDGIPFLKSVNTDGAVIKFDSAKYVEIRRNLGRHNNNLERIMAHFA